MNTKTMRLPPRRFLTPSKRKERDGFINSVKPSITMKTAPAGPPLPPPPPPPPPKPTTTTTRITTTISSKLPSPPPSEVAKSNQLLAGYLAHEFLSKGTLFGQPFDPAADRAEIVGKKEKMLKTEVEPSGGGGGRVEPRKDEYERYVEISDLLKRGGEQIQGIVNPTQLAHYLQM